MTRAVGNAGDLQKIIGTLRAGLIGEIKIIGKTIGENHGCNWTDKELREMLAANFS